MLIAGLDPDSLIHPATAELARTFVDADAALRAFAGTPITAGWRAAYDTVTRRYYDAMRMLHNAEDAIPGAEKRGMAEQSVMEIIAARGHSTDGSYVLTAYPPSGYRAIAGEAESGLPVDRRFPTLRAALDHVAAEIIEPEDGHLPWRVDGSNDRSGAVDQVVLTVDYHLMTGHKRINLAAQRWRVLVPVDMIIIQSAAAHLDYATDRFHETMFGGSAEEKERVARAARA